MRASNKHILILVLLYLSILLPLKAFSQYIDQAPPQTKTKISKSSVNIGEKLKYTISVYTKPNVLVRFSDPEELGSFEVLSTDISERIIFGKKVTTALYYLVAYDTGEETMPKLSIQYRYPGSKWENIRPGRKKINVKSVFETAKIEADVKPIEGPIGLGWPYKWHMFIGISLIATVGFLVFIYIRWRKNMLERLRRGPPREIVVYQKLSSLISRLKAKGEVGSSDFVNLAELLKEYSELRLKLGKKSMTSEEFLNGVREKEPFYKKHGAFVSTFLRRSDLVKFANHKPSNEESAQALLEAGKLLTDLMPEEG
ncbi:MAG: hypothetical protein HQ572_03590 [Candidatus Omnitrophica bacterium]|nr:hypothetical protein [Candidatus Omnitrophota bacterium]